MNILQQWLFFIVIIHISAELQSSHRLVTAEYGSDLSLLCTFQNRDSDGTIIQWLYQNATDNIRRAHWRPLFLNAQSLTPKETRYSIQQKVQQINRTFITYSTILTLAKVTDFDEGLYICKLLSNETMQMTYQVRVIQSLDITPKQLLIPANEIGQYSVRLNCILRDNHMNRRHHEIYWWHNNKRLGSQTSRYARIVKNVTQHSFISTLLYTGEPANVAGKYICESKPLRRYISVELNSGSSPVLSISSSFTLIISIFILIFHYENID
ncbi:unnamed protein product [Rotaria socialis]|uniref:Ig-like domain-containing protein n=1 Tax=Rotaria socialis TaxID=392032 RepID=A0A817UKL0_9BILA|nr:unnamed protein product [Rotaria socialis]CAF3329520.1 unnamed protein product [Rotaria socialis]CAF3330398.1 unnamed protein product [Rotaria socialis]CAF3461860.1 unnamed protein product [Rotaria socialis]